MEARSKPAKICTYCGKDRDICFGTTHPIESIRDRFAMAALTGIVVFDAISNSKNASGMSAEDMANGAYETADAMMKRREAK